MTDSDPLAPLFRVDVDDRGRALVIAPSGEIDLFSAPQVGATFEERRAQHELVVLDLRAVSFMDSMGVRMVMSMKLQAETDGCALVLVAGEDAPARRIIHIARLDEMFRWAADPDEALRAAEA